MINGPVFSGVLTFFVPLMLSSVLQLLFNAVDLVVVGRFTGSNALGAVGATTSLINMLTVLFVGVSVGANVQAARYIARGDREGLSAVVHTAVASAGAAGIFLLIFGQFITPTALSIMKTPADIIRMSESYMRIYFLGMPFFMLYNFGAAILRAAGDTRRPLFFLVIAGVLNACLNLLLVIVFDLGVIGVASATVFSQFISCVLVVITLLKTDADYRLIPGKLGIDLNILSGICRIGIPAGLQSTVISFSNALLQSSVNSLGSDAVAGFTAANNIMSFMFAAVNSVSQACMTFTSQNYAAARLDRMKSVLRCCLSIQFCTALTMGVFGTLFAPKLLGIYCKSEDVIAYVLPLVPETFLTYFLCGFMDCLAFTMRGMGRSTVPMLLSIIGTVGTRVLWVLFFFPMRRTIEFLMICYPLSWTATVLLQSAALTQVWRSVRESISIRSFSR